jgi:hypothetical protein
MTCCFLFFQSTLPGEARSLAIPNPQNSKGAGAGAAATGRTTSLLNFEISGFEIFLGFGIWDLGFSHAGSGSGKTTTRRLAQIGSPR